MRRAKAFCPGHVTGFFEICRGHDLLSTGSRGAGFSTSLGATSDVTVRASARQRVRVWVDGVECRAEVTKHAARYLLGKDRLDVDIETVLDLPVSQGFGMSAAGALSASLALSELMDLDMQDAYEAAHVADIVCGCGLGDVSGLTAGGVEIRLRPGLPPTGTVERIDGSPRLTLAVVGRRLRTKSVLTDPDKAASINRYGAAMVQRLKSEPTFDNFADLSWSFATTTGLASRPVSEVVESLPPGKKGSMSMLGNSVFSTVSARDLKKSLPPGTMVYECKVDTKGPRIVR
ncbi:MAG: GHMP kinase [Thermoplasmata archaeon]|jgi:pantoate kinase|nr:GHMP kinase [Thermoplasmata archaeon]